MLVIDKPAGLVVHPSHGHENDTMVNILLSKTTLAKGSDPARPGIVHRLDKDTSGLMIVAKSDLAYEYFVEEFRAKKIIRLYKAVCLGISKEESFSVSSYLTRQTKDRKKYSSSKTEEGKLAISHFKTLKIIKNKYSLLECELETGRTHQIRVHLKEKHFPILGDETYGHKQTKVRGLTRQALHSYKIGFVHPVTKKEMTFESEMPEDLKFLVD